MFPLLAALPASNIAKTAGKIVTHKYFISAVIAIILIVIIRKMVSNYRANNTVRSASDNIKNKDLSYNDYWYQTNANAIFSAMDGAGTDFDVIKNIISQLKTASDYYRLFVEFGIKPSSSSFSSFIGDLVKWFTDELSSSQKEELNAYLQRFNVIIP